MYYASLPSLGVPHANEAIPWKTIEETVRKVDEDKVKDCTEDVDALLVFAGLYSAVLTAFLIESYKNLAADETNSLLQQMVLQTANYKFTNGYLNSTFDPSLLPTFKAAVSDIRVNVCWFASLILSLSSASFGIAVKQWLREFLAIDCISPQERLRIAAFLPILLQISLLLFFVGLCFFTAAVHRSIGITSLFLVSCWAFLFLMSIIAPLFSPRCPYKTTLLKVPYRYARPLIRTVLGCIYRRLTALPTRLRRQTPTTRRDDAAPANSQNTHESPEDFLYSDDYMDLEVLGKSLVYVTDGDAAPMEEDMIRSTERNDHIVFHNIDGFFLDDNLLVGMQETLSQQISPPPLRDVLRSVITIIRRRMGTQKARKRVHWPWALSPRARIALVDMLADSMVYDLHRVDRDLEDWDRLETPDSEWTTSFYVLILLASPHQQVPKTVIRLFNALQDYKWWRPLNVFSYQMRMLSQSNPDWPARSMMFLAQSLDSLKAEASEECLRRIIIKGFVDREGWEYPETYDHLLERNTDESDGNATGPTPPTILAMLEVARVILRTYTLEQTQAQELDESEFPAGIGHLLEFVFGAIPRVKNLLDADKPLIQTSYTPSLYGVLTNLFTTRKTNRQFLYFLATHVDLLSWLCYDEQLFYQQMFKQFGYAPGEISFQTLTVCTDFFMSQSTPTSQSSIVVDSPAALLHLALFVYRYPTEDNPRNVTLYEDLFAAIHACHERIIRHNSHSDTNITACQYSDSNKQHTNTCEAAYNILRLCQYHIFKAPDEMIKLLSEFVCASRTLDRRGDKSSLIEQLRNAKAAAILKRQRGPFELEMFPTGFQPQSWAS